MVRKKSAAGGDNEPDAVLSIEQAMQELGQIVTRLESGQETLDESLKQFERGMVLLRRCHQQLDAAAERIEIVTRITEEGEVETQEFDGTSTVQRRQKVARRDSEDESDAGSASLF